VIVRLMSSAEMDDLRASFSNHGDPAPKVEQRRSGKAEPRHHRAGWEDQSALASSASMAASRVIVAEDGQMETDSEGGGARLPCVPLFPATQSMVRSSACAISRLHGYYTCEPVSVSHSFFPIDIAIIYTFLIRIPCLSFALALAALTARSALTLSPS
jgi:hypothetical protein